MKKKVENASDIRAWFKSCFVLYVKHYVAYWATDSSDEAAALVFVYLEEVHTLETVWEVLFTLIP